MTNDFTSDEFEVGTAMNKQLPDETPADPVAVVLMLQQEAGNTQQEHPHISIPLKHAEIKERVLRRMLENSLAPETPGKRPNLTIVK